MLCSQTVFSYVLFAKFYVFFTLQNAICTTNLSTPISYMQYFIKNNLAYSPKFDKKFSRCLRKYTLNSLLNPSKKNVNWHPPPTNFIKVNVCGAFDGNDFQGATGVAVRGKSENFLAAMPKKMGNVSSDFVLQCHCVIVP